MKNAPRAQYSQQPSLLFGMKFSLFFQWDARNWGTGGAAEEVGDAVSTLVQIRNPPWEKSMLELLPWPGRLPDPAPSPPRAHQSAPPPPWFWGLTDYIYHTCSSQGNGLNFIQYTPSGSAFKTHPQAHFSLSPRTPAAISHLYSGNKS